MSAAAFLRGPDAPPEPADVELRAGPLHGLLRGADLIHLRFGALDVLRQIYGAVRDEQWGTILPAVSGLEVTGDGDAFAVAFEAAHVTGELDFRWQGRIEGRADGTVVYELDGVAGRPFAYSRIGLCVLLAVPPYQGRPFRASGRGATFAGTLPVEIARQPFRDGLYWPAIAPFDALEIDLAPAGRVHLAFEGDEFELEDQRNWTDATFKVYSTPLDRGGPHRAAAGTRIRQRVTVSVQPDEPPRARRRKRPAPVELVLGGPTGRSFPPVGAVWPRVGPHPDGAALLARLGLAHARVDLDLEASPDAVPPPAIPDGTAVELAVWAGPESVGRLPQVLREVERRAPVARVIVVSAEGDVADPGLVARGRELLRAGGSRVPVGGGSDFWLAEVHRSPDDFGDLDFISFSITPQLHVFDDESIFDSLAFQPAAVAAARARVASGQVVVSPVTLAPRDSGRVRAGDPEPPDPRQPSLLAAAWAAASIGGLAACGAASATYFDSVGAGGLLPDGHAASAGGTPVRAFPVYQAIAAACESAGRPLLQLHSSDARRVHGSAVGFPDRVRLTLVNCSPTPERVSLHGLAPAEAVRIRRLDESTVLEAMADPAAALDGWAALATGGDSTAIDLSPYAVAWLDISK